MSKDLYCPKCNNEYWGESKDAKCDQCDYVFTQKDIHEATLEELIRGYVVYSNNIGEKRNDSEN